jgi:hypothetical protein
MKKITAIFFLASLFFIGACKKDTQSFKLGIDVQAHFNQDLVQVYIDGQRLLNRQLTTSTLNPVCSGDGQLLLTKNEGRHQIKVVVNNSTTFTESFDLTADLYIGINYYPDATVHIVYSDYKFMYR